MGSKDFSAEKNEWCRSNKTLLCGAVAFRSGESFPNFCIIQNIWNAVWARRRIKHPLTDRPVQRVGPARFQTQVSSSVPFFRQKDGIEVSESIHGSAFPRSKKLCFASPQVQDLASRTSWTTQCCMSAGTTPKPSVPGTRRGCRRRRSGSWPPGEA